MKLHELSPSPGSTSKKKRLGRGPGTGLGKTAGKGHKGLLARSGRANQLGFEGGQMPLIRRLPKRGFTNVFRIQYAAVNLKDLMKLDEGETITPTVLRERGVVKDSHALIKILGSGDIDRPLVIEAHGFSESAKKKIEKAGGQAKVIGRA